jgi:curved DNA-binding protein CbpA
MTDKEEEECQKILKLNDYYEILGIEKSADENQIKRAYRKLAIKFHPDKNKSKSAEEAFKKVNQAFSVLSNKEKRKHYDMFGTDGENINMNGGMEFDPFDVFNMFFGGMEGFSTNNQSGRRGQNGRTRIQFTNGNGSFTVFTTSGGFGPFSGFRSFEGNNNDEDDDENDDDDIFDHIFNNFGAPRNRHQNNNNHHHHNSQQRNNKNSRRKREMTEQERRIRKAMEQFQFCVQICPFICCLVFVIIPFFFRILLP